MRFVDEASIEVIAGKGGDGCLSFRRERCIPKGGPDGGNGGNGGSIYLCADDQLVTLLDYRYRRIHKARNGEPGAGKKRHGKNGADLHLPVPTNISVIDAGSGELIGKLAASGEQLLIANGGAGGAGNTCFKSSTNRAPRRISKGQAGEQRRIVLNLELLADVGLLGLPNAGKSTLLRALSNARPRVGSYPFTTKFPQLGVVERGDQRLLVADIPGLISGASKGAGMGHKFLKHLSKTSLLLHLVDCSSADATSSTEAMATVERELELYSNTLAQLPRWLVFTKIDCLSAQQLQQLQSGFNKSNCFYISALSGSKGQGVAELVNALLQHQQQHQSKLESDSIYQAQQAHLHKQLELDCQQHLNLPAF